MRQEFSKQIKRDGLKRSGMRCEATGPWYDLVEGQRCNADLNKGVEFDHGIADGIGGKPTLENMVCACIHCHDYKTRTRDIPIVAKTKRQSDRHLGIKKSMSRPMPCGRNSPLKKRMDGSVVLRQKGQ